MKMRTLFLQTFLATGLCVAFGFSQAESVKIYNFASDTTYPVQTALGVVTQIEIDSREQIKDFSSGLSNGWELVRRENVFYVKPKDIGVDTNLIVRTATHNYIFELKVVSSDWKSLGEAKDNGVNYKVSFKYPNDAVFAVAESSDSGFSIGFDAKRKYHVNYDAAVSGGPDWLVPLRVYDDGKFTYVHMKQGQDVPTGNFPSIYGRNSASEQDFIINTTVEKNIIVVHGVYPFLVLRHGEQVIGLRRN